MKLSTALRQAIKQCNDPVLAEILREVARQERSQTIARNKAARARGAAMLGVPYIKPRRKRAKSPENRD